MAKSDKGAIAEEMQKDLIEKLKADFEKLLSNKSIGHATVIFTVEGENEPQIYRKGHFYDNAAMVNHVLNAYRAKVAMELGL